MRRSFLTLEVGAVRCALFAACLVLPRSLLAQPEPLESRYQRGVALRAERRDADALAVFRAIYAETQTPRALAQVALAEAALGEWIDAETHLAEATFAVEDAWIRRNRAALEDTRRTIREHLGDLDVRSVAAGAELWLHGHAVATLPMARPVRVVAGTVSFEVRAAGYATVTRTVTVAPGALVRETVELSPAASVREAPPSNVLFVQPTLAGTSLDTRGGATQRTLGWGAGAGAGVFLVGGTVAYLVGLGDVSRYDTECPPPGTPGASGECVGLLGEIKTLEAIAVAGFVGGGVLAAASAVLLLTAPSGRGARTAGRGVSCGRGPGDVGVTCETVF